MGLPLQRALSRIKRQTGLGQLNESLSAPRCRRPSYVESQEPDQHQIWTYLQRQPGLLKVGIIPPETVHHARNLCWPALASNRCDREGVQFGSYGTYKANIVHYFPRFQWQPCRRAIEINACAGSDGLISPGTKSEETSDQNCAAHCCSPTTSEVIRAHVFMHHHIFFTKFKSLC